MIERAERVLADADETLEGLGGRESLEPPFRTARSLVALGGAVLSAAGSEDAQIAWAEGIAHASRAMLTHFPNNIFGDLDYAGASLWRQSERHAAPVEFLREAFELVAQLQALFGNKSRIAFRYSHDFLYGFDWARWVAREPETRGDIDPFDYSFLRRLEHRGNELLALIAQDDAKYPQLAHGVDRNPFGYSRSPDDERRVHHELARRGLIPVAAWSVDATVRWDIDFEGARSAIAHELGLARPNAM